MRTKIKRSYHLINSSALRPRYILCEILLYLSLDLRWSGECSLLLGSGGECSLLLGLSGECSLLLGFRTEQNVLAVSSLLFIWCNMLQYRYWYKGGSSNILY
jgi:hypothetical protein